MANQLMLFGLFYGELKPIIYGGDHYAKKCLKRISHLILKKTVNEF